MVQRLPLRVGRAFGVILVVGALVQPMVGAQLPILQVGEAARTVDTLSEEVGSAISDDGTNDDSAAEDEATDTSTEATDADDPDSAPADNQSSDADPENNDEAASDEGDRTATGKAEQTASNVDLESATAGDDTGMDGEDSTDAGENATANESENTTIEGPGDAGTTENSKTGSASTTPEGATTSGTGKTSTTDGPASVTGTSRAGRTDAPSSGTAVTSSRETSCALDGAAPCGEISPQLVLTFAELDSEGLQVARGAETKWDGTLTFSYDADDNGFSPSDPTQPIVVTFTFPRSPSWIDIALDPTQVDVPISPDHLAENSDGQLMYTYSAPVSLTITVTDAIEAEIGYDYGKVQIFARSSESGVYSPGYGIKELRFDPNLAASEGGAMVPFPLSVVLVAVSIGASLLRRRT